MYSQLKPLYHLKNINALKSGSQPKPVHVQLILSDLCNQDCHFCAYRMSNGLSTELFATSETHNPNRKIETEKAREIIEDCAEIGVRAIQFTGGGEPTVHKDCLELIFLAQELGMDTALVTNGVKLDPEHEAIQSLDWIRVSVDAGHPMTYAKIRGVSENHFHKVWDNVESLAKNYVGELGIGFVVTPDNFGEIQTCAKLAKEAGASNMRVGAVFSDKGIHYYGELIDDIMLTIQQAKGWLDDKKFKIIDLFGRRINDLESKSPEHEFCGYQYFTMYIGADLNVYRCCNTAYTKRGRIGNLEKTRLRDFAGDYEPFDARKCSYCQFLGQNRAIQAMIKPPRHINFT